MIEFAGVSKNYGSHRVLEGISLSVNPGEIVAIMGPNGCGKSTLLKMLAGFEAPTAGKISRPARPVGFVFQNVIESLFPWQTVEQHVKMAIRGAHNTHERGEEILTMLGLTKYCDKYPYQLSGGLAQLTAIARAVAQEPELFLLDEPFAALDYYTSLLVVERLLTVLATRPMTTVLVTHTLEQAILLADRIIILSPSPGKIVAEVKTPLPRLGRSKLVGTPAFDVVYREAFQHLQGFLCANV
ncbi:MAG: ABC transporter ATP-binding protein [Candidatus Magasanikbacteria bacterium]|nr:ABC transporter ATP-binding protein [Candidatus Magasanikbacteria bacterium]